GSGQGVSRRCRIPGDPSDYFTNPQRNGRVEEESEMNRNRARWIVQGVLAVLFAVAGAMKLITPLEVLSVMSPFPGAFIRFIGVCEVLGAVGLILPWVLRIRPGL